MDVTVTTESQIQIPHVLSKDELSLLDELRDSPPAKKATLLPPTSFGQHIADILTATVGSWRFIVIFWIILNIWGWFAHWDPYPFILLNLVLSFQAAYTAPIIMMSQNRQAAIDRHNAENDYKVNLKAELEIELLHQKLDLLREQEFLELIRLLTALEKRLAGLEALGSRA
jgi:uncharacterized membrane protein